MGCCLAATQRSVSLVPLILTMTRSWTPAPCERNSIVSVPIQSSAPVLWSLDMGPVSLTGGVARSEPGEPALAR